MKHTTMLLLLILLLFIIGVSEERGRIWDWYTHLDWYKQLALSVGLAAFFILTMAFLFF
jgi:hypothetical protein